jgi:uncharacterized membrane protein
MEKVEFLPPLTAEDKMLCGLAYPGWFIGPIFVLLSPKKQDPFLCFHSIQGLLVGLVSMVLELALLAAVWIFFQVAPNGGTPMSGLVGVTLFGSGLCATMLLFLVAFFLGWRASSGQYLKLPILGPLAERWMGQLLGMDAQALRDASISRAIAAIKPESSPTLPPIFPEDFNADAAKAYVSKLFPVQGARMEAPRPESPPQWSPKLAPVETRRPEVRPSSPVPRPEAARASAPLRAPGTVSPLPLAKKVDPKPGVARPKPFLPQTSRPGQG